MVVERANEPVYEAGCAAMAETEVKVGDKGKDKEGEEGDFDEEEEEYAFRFESAMNPLDFTEGDASGLQPYQQFELLEYEALAKKKRRTRESVGERSPKKARVEDNPGASFEKIMEVMNYSVRQKSRKVISMLNQFVRLAPNLPDPCHTLGLIYNALGNTKKAMDFYMIAAHLKPKYPLLRHFVQRYRP